VPDAPGQLSLGGRLFMLKIRGVNQANLTGAFENGRTFDVEWVEVGTPDNPASGVPSNFVWAQGRAAGAATFARLEGAWYGNDAKIYVVSTSGGGSERGHIWEYDPARERLRMLFQSPGPEVLNAPDNICVSPRGGLVLCEDGTMTPCVHGLTRDGRIFRFARNNIKIAEPRSGLTGDFSQREFAGATYSPDGKWLFFNAQTPGITFAVTGPWADGGL